jgi:hypothetical protein
MEGVGASYWIAGCQFFSGKPEVCGPKMLAHNYLEILITLLPRRIPVWISILNRSNLPRAK